MKVRGDRLLLTRLIQNLLDNAYKYGKPGGSVWLSLRREGGQVQLSVRDEGEGIAPELQEKIWQRFYQADPSRSGAQGAGLGLAMVEQIARLHGGDMSLESRPGEGSVFTLRLRLRLRTPEKKPENFFPVSCSFNVSLLSSHHRKEIRRK